MFLPAFSSYPLYNSTESGLKYPFEDVFRSITRTVLDNSCSEFLFCQEFFYAPRSSKSRKAPTGEDTVAVVDPAIAIAMDAFNEVFGKTLKLISVR